MSFSQRLSNSWAMLGACLEILKSDRKLLLFPLMALVSAAIVAVMFILPFYLVAAGAHGDDEMTVGLYVVLFFFYVAEYCVGIFFSVALVATVMRRMDGQPTSISDGLTMAMGRIWQILGYAVLAATVGMILRAIAERLGFLGNIVTSIIGVAWGLATFLVTPVLVVRGVGPLEAVKESAGLFRRAWGESVVGMTGLGLAFMALYFSVAIIGGGLAAVAFSHDMAAIGAVLVTLLVIAVAVLALAQSTLSGIFSAALYRYATTGQGVGPISRETLAGAFAPKAQKG